MCARLRSRTGTSCLESRGLAQALGSTTCKDPGAKRHTPSQADNRLQHRGVMRGGSQHRTFSVRSCPSGRLPDDLPWVAKIGPRRPGDPMGCDVFAKNNEKRAATCQLVQLGGVLILLCHLTCLGVHRLKSSARKYTTARPTSELVQSTFCP